MAQVWDKDTVAAKVALDIIKADLAKKYPEAAAGITDDPMEVRRGGLCVDLVLAGRGHGTTLPRRITPHC